MIVYASPCLYLCKYICMNEWMYVYLQAENPSLNMCVCVYLFYSIQCSYIGYCIKRLSIKYHKFLSFLGFMIFIISQNHQNHEGVCSPHMWSVYRASRMYKSFEETIHTRELLFSFSVYTLQDLKLERNLVK